MLFIEYPKCSTCQKARKYLISRNLEFIDRDIKLNNPSVDELKEFVNKSGLELKKFFNTSGLLYKELNLKDKLQLMTDEEKYTLLASNGMLVKRPILVLESTVLVGFNEKIWDNIIK